MEGGEPEAEMQDPRRRSQVDLTTEEPKILLTDRIRPWLLSTVVKSGNYKVDLLAHLIRRGQP